MNIKENQKKTLSIIIVNFILQCYECTIFAQCLLNRRQFN